jgi:hypothetical protein
VFDAATNFSEGKRITTQKKKVVTTKECGEDN